MLLVLQKRLIRHFCNFVIKKVLRNIKNALPFHLLVGYPIQIIVFDFRNFYARHLPIKQIKCTTIVGILSVIKRLLASKTLCSLISLIP